MTSPTEDHSRPDDAAASLPDSPDDGERDVQDLAVDAYWATARKRAGLTRLGGVVGEDALGSVEPPAWSFGTTPEEADSLLALVLAGTKTATVSAVATFQAEGVAVPRPGDLSIILDGRGRPRALITTTAVETRAFRDVDAKHAAAEGEGDLSLDHWRRVHEEFLTGELAAVGEEFTPESLVLLERFQLLDPRPPRPGAGSDVTESSASADSAD